VFSWRYFLRRVLISIVLLWLLSLITFAIYFAIPQEPANFVLGIRDTDANHATPGMVAEAHHRLGLDRPIPVQYAKFVSRTLDGDFGISWQGLSYDPNANLVGAAQNWSTTPRMCGGVADWASHMVLPWITFALFFIALYMRIVRVRLLDVLETDYVRAARAKGASESRVLRRHRFRTRSCRW
jgi:ABC-type dipeptide/oligopeptide/nickel transport system permease component